jgi:hypothetical protein
MNAKAEVEELMNAMLPFVEDMLAEQGEFYPYGAAMDEEGEIYAAAGFEDLENPAAEEIIEIIRAGFREGAKAGNLKATALFVDMLVEPPDDNEKVDAVAVFLDHRDNYSVVVFFPYVIDSGEIRFGEIFASEGQHDIFGGQSPSCGSK